MTAQIEKRSSGIYQVENLPQGQHYFLKQDLEQFQSLFEEHGFHGLVRPSLKTFFGIGKLNFLLKSDYLAQHIVYEPKLKYPLRGAEGVIKKIHFSGHTLALKALNSNSLTGYKQIMVFSDLIQPIFERNRLKTVDQSAATSHSLIRPWINGSTLNVIFDQLRKKNKEFANSLYTLLAKSENIKNAHTEIFLALTQFLETFGFIPMINNYPYHNRVTRPDDQLNNKVAAKFTKPGEEDISILKSQKIKMTVDCAIPDLDNTDPLSEQLVKDRLSNWILPDKLVFELSKKNNQQSAVNFLLQNMICLDPFYIRSDIGFSEGQ